MFFLVLIITICVVGFAIVGIINSTVNSVGKIAEQSQKSPGSVLIAIVITVGLMYYLFWS
jgi:type III secretory pathway component EscS